MIFLRVPSVLWACSYFLGYNFTIKTLIGHITLLSNNGLSSYQIKIKNKLFPCFLKLVNLFLQILKLEPQPSNVISQWHERIQFNFKRPPFYFGTSMLHVQGDLYDNPSCLVLKKNFDTLLPIVIIFLFLLWEECLTLNLNKRKPPSFVLCQI